MFQFYNCINRLIVNNTSSVLSKVVVSPQINASRLKHYQIKYHGAKNYWPQWSMMKDQRKRMTFKEYGPYKLRYNAIRKAEFLPSEIREIANHEISTVPRDAALLRIVSRCSITSRPRGIVFRWRLSRFIFRHLADYNKLAGVQRAFWG
ncbi:hypothetical protein PGB90_007597 [Kerria lacca]